jgi:hypothetical protein
VGAAAAPSDALEFLLLLLLPACFDAFLGAELLLLLLTLLLLLLLMSLLPLLPKNTPFPATFAAASSDARPCCCGWFL